MVMGLASAVGAAGVGGVGGEEEAQFYRHGQSIFDTGGGGDVGSRKTKKRLNILEKKKLGFIFYKALNFIIIIYI